VAVKPRQNEALHAGADDLGGVLRDYMEVTRRLQHTHETLQREVVRLRDEVETKDRELERRRRLAALGELAAGVAHEIRNPLGAIRLYSGLLRGELAPSTSAIDLIKKIDVGIHAIDCVVQDTLALAPRSGARRLKPLNEIIDGARDVCRAALESCGVELREQRDRIESEVLADSAALQRVFVNLLVNAAQASPRGGIVELRVAEGGAGEVEIRVLDEGSGLPDDLIDRIFDPFFTTKENGTGLGLTIAHRLIEANGGRLGARNRSERGAEFLVVLPIGGDEPCAVRPTGANQTSAA
jgi:signal transduction histidine kinase